MSTTMRNGGKSHELKSIRSESAARCESSSGQAPVACEHEIWMLGRRTRSSRLGALVAPEEVYSTMLTHIVYRRSSGRSLVFESAYTVTVIAEQGDRRRCLTGAACQTPGVELEEALRAGGPNPAQARGGRGQADPGLALRLL